MARLQLALNVSDLDAAIDFYTKLFETAPAKIRPGYANFAVTDPPLKLVLIEGGGTPGSLNHLGVEVEDRLEVAAAHRRLAGHQLAPTLEEEVSCCYAVQDKVWVDTPDGSAWEIYTVLADTVLATAGMPTGGPSGTEPTEAPCCVSGPGLAPLNESTP
ncbi:MAG: ArsI/CadI family heavy metal resistance metalloenzyme [Acidimicrobiales bacterium]|jgi:catechol 2,3-dioxygenase-like lactoylglutathione lyase family enzyme